MSDAALGADTPANLCSRQILLSAHDDAVNIVSNTFLTAWRRVQDIPACDNARLWLYKVAGHCVSNQQGAQRRYLLPVSRLADNPPPANAARVERCRRI